MNIAVLAASEFGYRVCRTLIEIGYPPCGIFTIPEKFEISYAEDGVENCLHKDMHVFEEEGIPVKDVNDAFCTEKNERILRNWNPDVILAAGWYYKVSEPFRQIAEKGAIGVHHSLLPNYRGGAPLVWAMINDESQAGTTLFYLDEEMDAGDMIAQSSFPITDQDTIKTVYEQANQCALQIIREQIPLLDQGEADRIPQNDEEATTFPQRSPEDGLIDWDWSARRIWNFVRAQTRPYPGAFGIYHGEQLTIWEAEIRSDEVNTAVDTGTIQECTQDGFVVQTGNRQSLHVTDYQYSGVHQISAGERIHER